jgi:hypothetical protein
MSTTGSNKGWHFATNDILRMTVTEVGDVQFRENNGGTPQVGMHWDYNDGRLGIGADAPSEKLDFGGEGWLKVGQGAFNNGGVIFPYATNSTSSRSWAILNDVDAYGDFVIAQSTTQTSNVKAGATRNNILTITPTGSIKIGIVSPDRNTSQYSIYTADQTSNAYASYGINLKVGTAIGGAAGGQAGKLTLKAGDLSKVEATNGFAGSVELLAGDILDGGVSGVGSDGAGDAGSITIRSGNNPYSAGSSSDAGNITIQAGNLAQIGNSNGHAGDISILAGVRTSNGFAGNARDGNVEIAGKDIILNPFSGGNVGIGTTDPATNLEISSLYGTTLRLSSTRNSNVWTPGQSIGQIQMYSADGTAPTPSVRASIDAVVENDAGNEIDLVFRTGSNSEKLRIANGGNVGIGTDDPNATLVISTNGAQGIEFFPTAASGVATTQYYNRSGAAYVRNRNIALDHTFNISGATDDAVTIASTGKVGVGIASPDHSLDVDGAIATGQVRHSKRPVFNFDFANSKELDSRFTFYRATRATYVDADGLVKYVNQNVPRFDHNPNTGESLGLLLEENRSNEIIDPVNMYSSWVEDNCAIQRNYALAPDGTWSAIRIQPDGTNNSSFAQQTRTIAYSTTYSISVYVKSDGADYAFLTFANTGFNGRATVIINLTNGNVEFSDGTSESSVTPFVEQHKNGWWRFGLTVTSDSSNGAAGSYELGPSNEATPTDGTNSNPRAGTDPTKALLVWGPQREVGTHVSTYIAPQVSFETRTSRGTYYDEDGIIQSAPAYAERITHGFDGAKVVKGGPIVEPARDNLHVSSEWNNTSIAYVKICGMISASGRSKADFQAENTTAPDGSLWPIITTNAITGGNYYYQNYSSLTTGVYYTYSVFFRLPTNNTENIRSFTAYAHLNTFGNYYYATYDFTTDSITQASAGSFQTVQKLPNGWRRLSISAQPTTNGSFDFVCHFNAASSSTAQSYDGGGGANKPIGYIFGPQLELGNQPTTYIPTGRSNNNVQIARAADVATFYDGYRLDDLCDIYKTDEINADEGTVYTEWSSKVPASDSVGGVFEMWDEVAGGSNGIDQRFSAFYVTNNYSVNTSYLGAGAIHKTSLAYEKDNVIDWYATLNGIHTGTNTVHKYNMKLTRLSLGRIDLNPAYMINGHIKRFVLYNNRLSLDEQKALTENN